MSETIGFIGLGIMGRPMAHNLLKAGYSLIVFDRHPETTHEHFHFFQQYPEYG